MILVRLIQGAAFSNRRSIGGYFPEQRVLRAPQGTAHLEFRETMNASRIAGIVLIAAGVLSLAYGSFSYTKETHKATVGPIELAVKDRESVLIPPWASIAAIVVGGVLALGVIGKR